MTVAELISLLSKLDQDAVVLAFSPLVYFEELIPEAVVPLQVCEMPARFVHKRPYAQHEDKKLRSYDYPENCEQNSPIIRAVLIAQ